MAKGTEPNDPVNPDDFEIIEGLPEPGDNRLAVLKVRIAETFRSLNRNGQRTAEDALELGHYFIEVKGIVGHGKFGAWIEEEDENGQRVNCEVSYRMANYYMALARSGKTPAIIANLGLRVAAETLGKHFDPETQKERKKTKGFEGYYHRVWNAKPPPKKVKEFKHELNKARREAIRSEQVAEEGRLDSNQDFPRPMQPGEALRVEWRAGIINRVAYVWALEYPIEPLRFKWIYREQTFGSFKNVETGEDEWHEDWYFDASSALEEGGYTWDDTVLWLRGVAAHQVVPAKFTRLLRDPIRTMILEDFWGLFADVLSGGIPVSHRGSI